MSVYDLRLCSWLYERTWSAFMVLESDGDVPNGACWPRSASLEAAYTVDIAAQKKAMYVSFLADLERFAIQVAGDCGGWRSERGTWSKLQNTSRP